MAQSDDLAAAVAALTTQVDALVAADTTLKTDVDAEVAEVQALLALLGSGPTPDPKVAQAILDVQAQTERLTSSKAAHDALTQELEADDATAPH